MSIGVQLVACFFAAVFFCFLLNQPLKTIPISGLVATAGYAVYLLLDKTTLAYFFATLLIAFSCEIAARIFKKTSTLFLVSSLIPLVPGVGLYRTMRYIAEDNAMMAVKMGTDTLMGICAIAMAITLSSIVFSNIHLHKKDKVS